MTVPREHRAEDRTVRLLRYFEQNDCWVHRDRIMHWTGFPSPSRQPVCAYVEFHNAVDRLNRTLLRKGLKVAGGIQTGEKYRLEEIKP